MFIIVYNLYIYILNQKYNKKIGTNLVPIFIIKSNIHDFKLIFYLKLSINKKKLTKNLSIKFTYIYFYTLNNTNHINPKSL